MAKLTPSINLAAIKRFGSAGQLASAYFQPELNKAVIPVIVASAFDGLTNPNLKISTLAGAVDEDFAGLSFTANLFTTPDPISDNTERHIIAVLLYCTTAGAGANLYPHGLIVEPTTTKRIPSIYGDRNWCTHQDAKCLIPFDLICPPGWNPRVEFGAVEVNAATRFTASILWRLTTD